MQPFKNFFQKPHLKNHLSETLEVGYTQFGPTLGIAGTLTAVDNVTFIHNILLVIQRLYDGSHYQFNWLAFRPHRFKLTFDWGIDFKAPSKFLLTPASPFTYNILFSDQNQYSRINPTLKLVKAEWETAQDKLALNAGPAQRTKLFEEFTRRQETLAAHGQLVHSCYWEEGSYALSAIFVDKDNKPILEAQRLFKLTHADVEQLKNNAGMIVADICGQPQITYLLTKAILTE